MRRALVAATLTTVAAVAAVAPAMAATIPAGTKILCVLSHGVDSRTVKVGTDFTLVVDDPTLPQLKGAKIHGHVTDVAGPGGLTRARIGWVIDYIKLPNGTREPIHIQATNKNVTSTNTAQAQQEAVKFSLPPMPVGTVTPGPVAWQMNFRRDAAPSVTPPPVGSSSGYVYAQQSNENIVIPPGAPVTMQLTADLTTP